MMQQMMMRKIQRSTQSSHDDNDRSQSRDHIPDDLIVEILSRLPVKSIVRSRSVSKLWSSITTTPGFINSFETRSWASSRPCVLLIVSKHDKLFIFSYPLHHNTYTEAESYQFTVPNNGNLQRYDSVHGLIYLQTSTELMILNPTVKRFFTLPKPQSIEGKHRTGLLGYDPIDCKYKVLCEFTGDKIGILTLGAQESWRIISEGIPRHFFIMTGCKLCINGVMYYDCLVFGLPLELAIMSFDLRSEKFRLIQYPMDRGIFVSYEGRLAVVISSKDSGVRLWILENAENHRWVYKRLPSPDIPHTRWEFKGVTDSGEFIYIFRPQYSTRRCRFELVSEKRNAYEWFDIVYFNPKKNSLREVKIQGVTFDDYRGLGEAGYDLRKDLSVIPNHIESLM